MCVPKVSQGCETKKHTQTLTLRIFLQFITTAHKPHTPHLPYKRFAGFAKCSKPPTPLPPLSKGGGLTARHKLLLCCVFTCDMFTFLIYQTFLPSRRRDCRTTTPTFRRASVCVCLYGFTFALSLSLFVGEELAPPVES